MDSGPSRGYTPGTPREDGVGDTVVSPTRYRPPFQSATSDRRGGPPPRKRKATTRSRTGCLACRSLHIRCIEGPVLPTGGKVICRRCWETDRACMYPAAGATKRRRPRHEAGVQQRDEAWEQAVNVETWPGPNPAADSSIAASSSARPAPLTPKPPLPPIHNRSPAEAAPPQDALLDGRSLWEQQYQQPLLQPRPEPQLHRHTPVAGPSAVPTTAYAPQPLVPRQHPVTQLTALLTAVAENAAHDWGYKPANDWLNATACSASITAVDTITPQAASLPLPVSPAWLVRDDDQETESTTTSEGLSAVTTSIVLPTSVSALGGFVNSPVAEFPFVHPSPALLLTTGTIASFAKNPADRSIMSYFESEGRDEIVATFGKQNWIYSELFPRVLNVLAGCNGTEPGTLTSSPSQSSEMRQHALVRPYITSSLLYLSYVHRGNVETCLERSSYYKTEARKWAERGSMALLKAKLSCPKGEWQTEEYLMGFFVRCMGDMLNGTFLIFNDTCLPKRPPSETMSPFSRTLWDMIATYATHVRAFSPAALAPHPATVPALCFKNGIAPLELPPTGPNWVDTFFGYSRKAIALVDRANGLVSRRVALLAKIPKPASPGSLPELPEPSLLAAEYAILADGRQFVAQLQNPGFDEYEASQTSRVRRGTEVVRAALRVLVLCEVLNVDLDDERIHSARRHMVELVADCEPSAVSGFHWPVSIMAIYTHNPAHRPELLDLIRNSLALSFGRSYRSLKEVLHLCWDIFDSEGGYPNGIAPWREGMHALGSNLWF